MTLLDEEYQLLRAWIDRTGQVVIGPRPYLRAESFAGGVAAFQVEEGWGLIDRQGEVVLPPRYRRIRDVVDGRAAVQDGELWGFVDPAGRPVVAPRYRATSDFVEGLAAVLDERGWHYIDQAGEVIVPGPFEDAIEFREGLGAVRLGGRWGFVDRTGRVVIEPRFDQAGWFTEGLALVEVGGKWGFVDRGGAVVIEPRFELAAPFSEGLARFQVTVELSELHAAAVQEMAWVEEELGRADYRAKNAEDLERMVQALREMVELRDPALPAELGFDRLVRQLHELAAQRDLKLRVTRLAETRHEHHGECRMSLELAGAEEEIDAFLRRLEQEERFSAGFEQTAAAGERRTVETTVYWMPPPAISEPQACRRFLENELDAATPLERRVVASLEAACRELDAAVELRRLELTRDALLQHGDRLLELSERIRGTPPAER